MSHKAVKPASPFGFLILSGLVSMGCGSTEEISQKDQPARSQFALERSDAGGSGCLEVAPRFTTLRLSTVGYSPGSVAIDRCTGAVGHLWRTYQSSTTSYVYFESFDADGKRLSSATRVSESVQNAQGSPLLSWHGGSFRAAWTVVLPGGRTQAVLYAELNADGSVRVHETSLASSDNPVGLRSIAGDPVSGRVLVGGSIRRGTDPQGALWRISPAGTLEGTTYIAPHSTRTQVFAPDLLWTTDGVSAGYYEISTSASGSPYLGYVRFYPSGGSPPLDASLGPQASAVRLTELSGGVAAFGSTPTLASPKKFIRELRYVDLTGPTISLDPSTRFGRNLDGAWGFTHRGRSYWSTDTQLMGGSVSALALREVSGGGLDLSSISVRGGTGPDPRAVSFAIVADRFVVTWSEEQPPALGGSWSERVAIVAAP